ncbi:MAG: DUF2269 family protein [Proteobacteria bacterium]|nr:DUF2269 family protein [Pseudomonadota bacterium]
MTADWYLLTKWIHIVSSTILFGTGIGSAFYMLMAHLQAQPQHRRTTVRHVVLADWLFTTPAVIIQLLSGLLLVHLGGYSLSESWIIWALALYVFAGLCWVPVVAIQIHLGKDNVPDDRCRHLFRWWLLLGCLAFPTVLVIFWLMVFKPV